MGRTLLAPASAFRTALAEQFSLFLRQAAPDVYVVTLTSPDGVPQRLRVVREQHDMGRIREIRSVIPSAAEASCVPPLIIFQQKVGVAND